MENGFGVQPLSHPALVLAALPDAIRMQLGPFPFSPQIDDMKAAAAGGVHGVSAYRLRYGGATATASTAGYGGLPAQLIQHLPPQLFPTTVDPRAFFQPAAFRPFNLSSGAPKLFSSAFAPPNSTIKSVENHHENGSELSPGSYNTKLYDNDDDSSFRSADRESDMPSGDLSAKSDTPNLSPKIIKEEKNDGKLYDGSPTGESDASSISEDDQRGLRRPKRQFGPSCCPICGMIVIGGEAEGHFFKEVDRLSQLSRDRKFLFDRFSGFNSSYPDENGHGMENGLPKGRWETYQRIKANRLGRLRIKNRKRKSGELPLCPVCNEKLQGNVEDINLHVELCLKKHSEAEDEEDENIDVEGDSEMYGEYEWTGRHLARASTLLAHFPGSYVVLRVEKNAAGLLSSSSASTGTSQREKEDDSAIPESTEEHASSVSQPDAAESGHDVNMDDERRSSVSLNLTNGTK